MSEPTRPPPTVCSVCGAWFWPNAPGFLDAYRVERVRGYEGRGLFAWYCSLDCLRRWFNQ